MPADFSKFRVVECHKLDVQLAHPPRDEALHLVEQEHDLHALCGHEVALVCRFIPLSEFGKPSSEMIWCPRCLSLLSKAEDPVEHKRDSNRKWVSKKKYSKKASLKRYGKWRPGMGGTVPRWYREQSAREQAEVAQG